MRFREKFFYINIFLLQKLKKKLFFLSIFFASGIGPQSTDPVEYGTGTRTDPIRIHNVSKEDYICCLSLFARQVSDLQLIL
jgi:hypothetical protein